MPNHVHLIIRLPFNEAINHNQEAIPAHAVVQQKGLQTLAQNSIASIINHLKGKVKRWCNKNGHSYFEWQARYHDHIIRDSKSFNRISNYIVNNIYNWADDENNQEVKNFRKNIRI